MEMQDLTGVVFAITIKAVVIGYQKFPALIEFLKNQEYLAFIVIHLICTGRFRVSMPRDAPVELSERRASSSSKITEPKSDH